MAKHQIFLIHGMGNYDNGWSLLMQEEIRKSFAAYRKLDALAMVDRFDLVEILYDDVFEKWRRMWKEDAAAAAGALSLLGLDSGVAGKLVSLAQSTEGDDFFRTHVLDVVLYRYVKQFQEEVNQNLRRKILDHLNAFPKGDLPQWSAVAHSLGTAVLHNTLHGMFTHPVDGVLLGDAYMPAYLFMIANVGKVLWNLGGDFYSSKVKPHPTETMGLCWRYCNFHHELDPFVRVDPFNPPKSWFPEHVARERVFADVEIPKQDIQDLNVHGLTHYWTYPPVHVEILRTVTGVPELISDAERNTALAKWRKHTLAKKALNEAQDELRRLSKMKTDGWAEVVQRLFEFRDAVLEDGIDKREGETLT